MTEIRVQEASVGQLNAGLAVLKTLTPEQYCQSIEVLRGASIGAHWRHVVEHFSCFVTGAPLSFVDYTMRCRDARLEVDARFAIEQGETLCEDIELLVVTATDYLDVRHEPVNVDSSHRSSVGRELEFLFSHTAHHYAMIAVGLDVLGVDRPKDFGLAESTRQFRAAQAAGKPARPQHQ